MSLVNIGVVGSCVTRDNFNSKFNSEYSRIFNCVVNINHISIPSLLSSKVRYSSHQINHPNNSDNLAIINELDRNYMNELRKLENLDYLILDFWSDVFFGSVLSDRGTFTNNHWRVKKTDFYNNLEGKRVITLFDDYEDYTQLWRQSITELVLYLNTNFPDLKIVINKARAITKYTDNEGKLKTLTTSYDIKRANELWSELDEWCINKFELDSINVMDLDNDCSFEKHPWKKYMVHYTKEFYERFLSEFTYIVLKNSKIQLFNNKHIENYKEPNLIQNSNFLYGLDGWDGTNIFETYKGCLVARSKNLSSEKYNSLFSSPIKVIKGRTYTFEFKFLINSDTNFDSYRTLAAMRLFKSKQEVAQKDAIWFINIRFDNNQHLRENIWINVNYKFTAKHNGFLRVGPFLSKNGHVTWKDFVFSCSNEYGGKLGLSLNQVAEEQPVSLASP